jgi:hypothetical protein
MSNPSDVVKQRRGGGRVYDTLSAPLAAQQNEHLVTRQEEPKERGGHRLNTTDHESACMWAGHRRWYTAINEACETLR